MADYAPEYFGVTTKGKNAESLRNDLGADNVCSDGLSDSDSESNSESDRRVKGSESAASGLCVAAHPIRNKPSPPVERICPNCNQAFLARWCDIRRGRGLFCGRTCLSASNGRRVHALHSFDGPNNPGFKNWASKNQRAYVDRFRARYPEKARAHDAVKKAVRSGRLVKPTHCERCDCLPTEPLHGHHFDYSRPLDVMFVCRRCHRYYDTIRNQQPSSPRKQTA